MNTTFYRYALEVERTKSITQAAENLYMAQPNLSKAIKDAEDSLGYSLFERTPKGVLPTPKGRLFLEHARVIVQQMEQIEAIADDSAATVQRLNVSIPRSSYISKALSNFAASLDKSHEILLNIIETSSVKTVQNIVTGEFDLGIIRYQNLYENYFEDYLTEKNLSSDLIWDFQYLALMSQSHKLAGNQRIQPDDLMDSIEIIHGDNAIPYLSQGKIKVQEIPLAEKRIYLYERANQFELLSHVPETFMWVSPIPQDILERYKLVQRRCDFSGNHFKDMLIYRSGYPFSELERKFMDLVYQAKNEVSLKQYS